MLLPFTTRFAYIARYNFTTYFGGVYDIGRIYTGGAALGVKIGLTDDFTGESTLSSEPYIYFFETTNRGNCWTGVYMNYTGGNVGTALLRTRRTRGFHYFFIQWLYGLQFDLNQCKGGILLTRFFSRHLGVFILFGNIAVGFVFYGINSSRGLLYQ